MVDLAKDWLFFLLLPLKAAYKSSEYTYSEYSTPTPQLTEVLYEPLLERDGGRCVVTRFWNIENPNIPEGMKLAKLRAAHIIPRSIAVNPGSGYEKLPATINILKNFAALSDQTVTELETLIDKPENGMMLEIALHDIFHDFSWCLLPLEELGPNAYRVHWLKRHYLNNAYPNGHIVQFANHARNDIKLPNPKLIAIHAAIAHVLHFSGAAEALDKIIDDLFGDFPVIMAGKITSFRDLELRMSLMAITGGNMHGHQLHPAGVFVD